MIQFNPTAQTRDETAEEPVDMWCWLTLLGWKSPLFEDDDQAPAELPKTEQPKACRLGIARAPTSPNALPEELDIESERRLGWAVVNDNCARAKERLFFHGLRTLARVVDAYEGRGLTTAELIDHGARGLRKAVGDFDPRVGVRFSTVASWWIKQSVKQAMFAQRHQAVAT